MEWRTARLADVTDISSGITLGRDLRDRPARRVPYLRVANVKDGWLDLSEVKETEATEDEIRACRLEPGDILLTEGGDPDKLGRGTFWQGEVAECIHQNHIFRVRSDPAVFDPAFLAFQFGSGYGKAYFLRHGKQTTGIASINKTVLSHFPLLIPPINEQRRIAGRLREQIAEADRAQAAVQEQLRSSQTLPAAFLRAAFNRSSCRHWPRHRLGELCEIAAKQVDPRLPEFSCLPHVSGENIESGLCRLVNVRTAGEDGMISGKYLFEAGDVLYSKLRPYLRKVAIAESPGLCSADMYPLRVNPSLLDVRFTAWLLLSEDFSNYAIEESQRSRMPKLNREQLFAWIAPVPPLETQRKLASQIGDELAAAMQLRQSLESRLSAIEHLPAALLRQAFFSV